MPALPDLPEDEIQPLTRPASARRPQIRTAPIDLPAGLTQDQQRAEIQKVAISDFNRVAEQQTRDAARVAARPMAEPADLINARRLKGKVSEVAKFKSQQLEEFDKANGDLYRFDETNQVEDGDLLALDSMRTQAEERVGTLRGMLTTAAAGDPTEQAARARQSLDDVLKRAQARNPNIRSLDDLPLYRETLKQQRARLAAERDAATKRKTQVELQYGERMAQLYGPPPAAPVPPPSVAPKLAAAQQAEAAGQPVQAEPEVTFWREFGKNSADLGRSFAAGAGGLVKMVGDIYGLATGDMDNATSNFGAYVQEYWNEGKSADLRARETARQQAMAATDSEFGKAVEWVKATVTDPTLLANAVGEQIPNIVPGAGVGMLTTKGAAKVLLRKAVGDAAKIAAAKAAVRIGTAAGVAAGAGMQGADVGADSYAETLAALETMPDEQAMGIPEIAEAVAAGEDIDVAKAAYAIGQGRKVGIGAAALSLLTNALPGGNLIERAAARGAAGAAAKGAAGTLGREVAKAGAKVAGEAASEVIEEGGGQAIANVAARQGIDPQRPVMQGVGEAAGPAALVGGVFGGPAAASEMNLRGQPPADTQAAETVPPTSPEPAAAEAQDDPDFTPGVDDELAAEMGATQPKAGMVETQAAETASASAIPAPISSAPVDPATASPALDNPSSESPVPSEAENLSQEPPVGIEAAPPVTPPEQKSLSAGSIPAPATNLREPAQAQPEAMGVVSPASGEAPASSSTPAPEAVQITVQQRQGKVPGFVQVDEIRDGKSTGSANPFDARARGIDVPEVPDWLPTGRYTLAEVRKAIADGPPVSDVVAQSEESRPPKPEVAGSIPADVSIPSRPPAAASDQPQETPQPTPAPAPAAGPVSETDDQREARWDREMRQERAARDAEMASRKPAEQDPDFWVRREVERVALERGWSLEEARQDARPALRKMMSNAIRRQIATKRPFHENAIGETYGIAKVPAGYVKKGDSYVYEKLPRPAAAPKREVKASPTIKESSIVAPAPIVARGNNKPAEFVRAISKATGLTGTDRPLRAVADLSTRLHRAAPADFEGMEVNALSEAEWQANPATGRMTPDSAAAYNPETNTLFLRTERVKEPTALVSAIAHESGHFAEKFALPEALVAREWAKLEDAQIEEAAANYNPDDQRSAAQIRKDPRARSEWVAQQFARVVAGKAKTVPAAIRARLEAFFAAMKEFATKWLGSDFASSPAFDAEVLRVMGFNENAEPVQAPPPSVSQGQKLTPETPRVSPAPSAPSPSLPAPGGVTAPAAVAEPARTAPKGPPSLGGNMTDIWRAWKNTTGTNVTPGHTVTGFIADDVGMNFSWGPMGLERTQAIRQRNGTYLATTKQASDAEIRQAEDAIGRGAFQIEERKNTGVGGIWVTNPTVRRVLHQATGTPLADWLASDDGKAWAKRVGYGEKRVKDTVAEPAPTAQAPAAPVAEPVPAPSFLDAVAAIELPPGKKGLIRKLVSTEEGGSAIKQTDKGVIYGDWAVEKSNPGRYTITHMPTGLGAGGGWGSLDEALTAIKGYVLSGVTRQELESQASEGISKIFQTNIALRDKATPAWFSATLGTPALRQTDTPEFRRWFGDSKVVDANGKPLVVYHGTKSGEFSAFKAPSFFTSDPAAASKYTERYAEPVDVTADSGRVYPVYLSLKNPTRMGQFQMMGLDDAAISKLKSNGFDGAMFTRDDGVTVALAFEPEQIKSAIGNSGAFDPANSSILGTPADPAPDTEPETRLSQSPRTERAGGFAVPDQSYLADRPWTVLQDEARTHVAEVGQARAIEDALDPSSPLPGDTKQTILFNAFDALSKRMLDPNVTEGEHASLVRQMEALSSRSNPGTRETARELSARGQFVRDQRVATPIQQIDEVRKRQDEIIGPDGKTAVDDAEVELNKPNREVGTEIGKRAKEKAKAIKVSKPVWEQYREDAAERMVRFVDDTASAPKAQAPLAEFTSRVVAEMKAKLADFMPDKTPAERANLTPLEIITEAIANKAKGKEVFDAVREQFVKEFGEDSAAVELIDAELANIGVMPYSAKTRERAIKEAFKAMQAKVADLAKQHVTKTNRTAADLAADMVAQAGLKQADADALAADLDAEARKQIQAAREKALVRLKEKAEAGTKRAKKVITALEKLTTLNNLGALTRADLMDAVAKELNLPKVNPADLRRIVELADKVENAPNPLARSRLEYDLMREVRVVKGIKATDVGLAVWLSNLLSGPMTQVGNLVGNTIQTTAQVMALAATNPSRARFAFSGWVDGLGAGFTHAKDIVKTGTSLREMGEAKTGEIGNVLETVSYERDFKRLPKNLATGLQLHANALRYVSRAMRAADAVFFYPAKEAYARVMVAKLLEGQYQGKELAGKVREALGMAPDQFVRFTKQAETEGFTDSLDKALRVHQLIEEFRMANPEVRKIEVGTDGNGGALGFAKEATYNQDPTGFAGAVYRIANEGKQRIPALTLILPFLRTPTNVFNNSLNFTPIGAKRALLGTKSADGKAQKQFTADERARLYFQSIAGTAGMAAILAAALADIDDEDPWFTITAKGTGDYKKNEQLEQAGWRPFSIKFGKTYWNYRDTPFLLPLAAIGHVVDAKRYQKGKDELAGRNPWLNALFRLPPTIFETSMLSGLGILADIATGDYSPAKVEAFIANSATSAIVPNAVKQVDRFVSQERRDIDGIGGRVGAAIPGLRQTGSVRTDVLGEAVTTSPTDRVVSIATDDGLRSALIEKKVFVSVPSKDTRLDGRPMTEDEFKAYYRFYGAEMNRLLTPLTPQIRRLDAEKVGKIVDRVETTARERAKAKVREENVRMVRF